MQLVLPFPPSVNSYWRYGQLANGVRRHMISKRGRAYRSEVVALVQSQVHRAQRGTVSGYVFPRSARLKVSMVLQPPDARTRDIDNFLKAPLDALTHAGVWVDDSQIDKLTVVRMPKVQGGRLVVTVDELDE